MTDAQEALVRVREALSAGPTPGKWTVDIHGDQVHVIDMDVTAIARVMAQRVAGPFNAAFIAACSPANVSDILAHIEAQAAEIERLTAERDELRRQLAEAEQDARRYRWLRNEANTARKCDPMVCIYPLDEQDLIDGDRLDVAIDAAMRLTRPAEES